MTCRQATSRDLDLLAEWNHQLIHDEGHSNPMTVAELRERMVRWLASDYNAVIFLVSDCDAGYALFRETDDGIYLRQLFVTRDQRGKGFGTEMLRLLRSDFWPAGQRVTVSVLAVNPEALKFHRHAGFVDY